MFIHVVNVVLCCFFLTVSIAVVSEKCKSSNPLKETGCLDRILGFENHRMHSSNMHKQVKVENLETKPNLPACTQPMWMCGN